MRIILFILIISLPTNITFGQNSIPFPTDSATWTMDIQTQGMSFPPQTSHQLSYYKTNGDTLINGKLFARISIPYLANYCFIREDSGLVYCKYGQSTSYDTTEFILYNFNLVQGESLSLPMAGYTITYHPASVYAIDYVLIGIETHKRIRINSWIPFDFVEGVGALQGLMYPEIPWVDFWGDLTCFSRKDTIQYTSNFGPWYAPGNCWLNTDIEETKFDNFSVYPNPASNQLIISNNNQVISKINIYNITGEIIKTIPTDINVINVADLHQGIYLLRITINDEIITRKFVKQ